MLNKASLAPELGPPLILVIPEARVDALPMEVAALIVDCEAQYSRGQWFVTVPADLSVRFSLQFQPQGLELEDNGPQEEPTL